MKWTNPGHEFDKLGRHFQENSDLYIYSTEEYAYSLAESLGFLGKKIYFIQEKSDDLCGDQIDCVKLSNVLQNINGKIILIPIGYTDPKGIIDVFESSGYKSNINLFWAPDFIEQFLPIYALYVCDILYFPSLSFLCTTICNLNCEKCLAFKPYNRKLEHGNLTKLKESVDILFSIVDRVGFFHVSGGEPFLYPYLTELLTYIAEKYVDKIGCLATVTNCTVIPNDELCEIIKKFGILVQCDDYRKQLPSGMNKFSVITKKFQSMNIDYEIRTPISWIDLFPPKRDWFKLGESELIERYNACANPYAELHNGSLSSCNYMGYAVSAGLIDDRDCDWCDLSKCSNNYIDRKKLLEFRMGYSLCGYVEFCKYCNGFPGINPCSVLPAKQVRGRLSWVKK